MDVVFCESCCGLPSFWRMMNRTRSSTCVLEGGAIDRWPTEAPRRPQPAHASDVATARQGRSHGTPGTQTDATASVGS